MAGALVTGVLERMRACVCACACVPQSVLSTRVTANIVARHNPSDRTVQLHSRRPQHAKQHHDPAQFASALRAWCDWVARQVIGLGGLGEAQPW